MVEPAYFSADFSVSEDTICLNDPVTLDFNFNQAGITPFNINYTVGIINYSSGPINNNGIHNISISPSVGNNNYIITSIVDSNGCINQNILASQNIYVNNLPDINIVESVNPICNGDSSILLFSSSAGTPPFNVVYNSNGIPASQVVLASGSSLIVNPNVTTTYQLDSVADANQCLSILSDNITLIVNELPDINWSVPSGVCDEEIVYLSMEFINGNPPWSVIFSINNTEYNFPPTSNTIDSLSILPSNNSTYGIVSLTDGNDCKEDINEDLTIISYPLPEGNVDGGGSICNNGSTTDIIFTISTGTPPYTLNYYSGIDQNQVANIGHIYTLPTSQSGIFTINEIVDSRNCKAKTLTGSAQVIVNPLPEANITAYPQVASIIDPLIYFIDNSEGHITGMWNFDDTYTLNSNFDKLTHMYRDTGTFQVSLQVESDSGCIDIAYQTIIINPSFTIYIPNSYTPNNDLKNDFFLPIIEGVTDYELSIYDRLGNNIYTTNKHSNDYYDCINNNCEAAWNGKVNNSELYATKGVYIYSIKLTDIKGKTKTYEGTVTLIR
jgi:gliding motility-associated-like protein